MDKQHHKQTVSKIIKVLEGMFPNARTALNYSDPLQLLVAAILSAQCTDERVNRVTRDLFRKYPSAGAYAQADPAELEADIRPTGFFRNKAKSLKGCCTDLVERFNGEVPPNLDDLVSLRGIGRKTANLVLGEAFGIPGIVADTHVIRLARRLGLTEKTDPVKVELDLMEIVPKKQWTRFSNLLILHGRTICVARSPKHESCTIVDLCQEGIKWKSEKK
jgi:endonuclease-3